MSEWMAIYTKPRSEMKVAERLTQKGFEVYCPLQTTIRQWSDRKKKVTSPIFPSYVFIRIEEIQRMEILQDQGVLNFVFYCGKPAIIREDEIQAIQLFLGELDGKEYSVQLNDYKVGEEVDIIAGPLIGLKGLVDAVEQKTVRLLVKSLGAIIKVEINKHHLI